jgi:hypothetical protein
MTELVIKEATIKQQSNIIRKLKGQNYEWCSRNNWRKKRFFCRD